MDESKDDTVGRMSFADAKAEAVLLESSKNVARRVVNDIIKKNPVLEEVRDILTGDVTVTELARIAVDSVRDHDKDTYNLGIRAADALNGLDGQLGDRELAKNILEDTWKAKARIESGELGRIPGINRQALLGQAVGEVGNKYGLDEAMQANVFTFRICRDSIVEGNTPIEFTPEHLQQAAKKQARFNDATRK